MNERIIGGLGIVRSGLGDTPKPPDHHPSHSGQIQILRLRKNHVDVRESLGGDTIRRLEIVPDGLRQLTAPEGNDG